jgi:hypothetical protein
VNRNKSVAIVDLIAAILHFPQSGPGLQNPVDYEELCKLFREIYWNLNFSGIFEFFCRIFGITNKKPFSPQPQGLHCRRIAEQINMQCNYNAPS